ncbi:hypothetical protein JMJ77_0007627 [Colletotrichum scovillei]|uniref:Uncharacterized protein n=1 Tax=Colletotrichum scovillei TaxID=1209932 RepID=A0A9P7RD73_9PEZI|nr:hypothetical protein JMJ77_0007627 [Colletotrichum scovillei]KAG7074577.1 hypothetical protein JMJ76_0011053 [Colletotrichum scovillei]KAG7081697.1 hypothetical protein JMJ78_0003813 [Colletotrichum scovillei]
MEAAPPLPTGAGLCFFSQVLLRATTRRVRNAVAGHSSYGLAIEARGKARTVEAVGFVQLMRQSCVDRWKASAVSAVES